MRKSEKEELSRREREIALAYADGANYRAIGERLFISPSTVRTHLGTIYRKLGVSSKIALLHAMSALDVTPEPARQTGPVRWTSVAIMPFRASGTKPDDVADGLVTDIIARLAMLRSVRVIARGSVFAMAERGLEDSDAAQLLGVDYLVSGNIRRNGEKIEVTAELSDTRNAQLIRSSRHGFSANGVFDALDGIVDEIVTSLASEIEIAERNRALTAHPDSLGAWESYHRGLWHMYRFNGSDNAVAQGLFRRTVEMDPTFARAWAGLSFTHFQTAFLLNPEDRGREIGLALDTAGRSLEADEFDPTAHWAMGRALWLRGAGERSIAALETSVSLAPNFSLGHYALAFVNCQSGEPAKAIDAADYARKLSPFDPLLFGILASRAMALYRNGDFATAAETAMRAAERPNAHHHIWMIAALCLSAAGRSDEAHDFATRLHAADPDYHVDGFLSAFWFTPEVQAALRVQARQIGMG